MEPRELEGLNPPKIDPSKPLIISGRGPQWLYSFLAHHYHFCRILATFEPRANKGIVIEAPSRQDLGKGIDLESGEMRDIKLGANGVLDLGLIRLGGLQLLRAETKGDRLVEPSSLREVDWDSLRAQVDASKPILAYLMAPIWVGARLTVEFSNLVPWYAVFDPKLEGGVVTARHAKNVPSVGKVVRVRILSL